MLILVDKCCFLVDLRKGVYIWAWLNIVFCLAGIILCSVYFSSIKDDDYLVKVFVVLLISFLIQGLINMLLATGVRTKRSSFVKPYFIVYLVSLILRVSFILISVFAYQNWISLLGLLIDVVPVYMLAVIVSVYKKLLYPNETDPFNNSTKSKPSDAPDLTV